MPRRTDALAVPGAALTLGLLLICCGSATLRADGAEPEAKYKVRVIPNARIPMRDGVELAARITRPDTTTEKFPAILGYTPYRRLGSLKAAPSEREFNHALHGSYHFAERGYVVVDYDARGTGNSGGSTQEMYADAERQDGYDMVEWAAAQPWCNGAVGMWGMSYGGVDTWQVAARNPPSLKAVIVRSGTDDVYGDWTYPGGVPRSLYILGHYAPLMAASNFAPPDPDLAGEKWAEIWDEHLNNNIPWSIGFLKHQRDDPYWSARSVRPGYDRIRCPVFVIEGWADWYQTAELRAFAQLDVPKRALIGPWAHYWPENAFPGPRIDGRREYLKWFDHWLKGVDNGVEREPPVTIFVRQYQPPAPMYLEDKGSWRQEREWPLARASSTAFHLRSDGRLSRERDQSAVDSSDSYPYNPAVGAMSGILGRGSVPPWAMPLDQRLDESYSLVYSTDPLPADVEITGNPSADLFVASTAEVAYFVVRLCDVAPDGTSKLVSDGGLNATHRGSRSKPERLRPGEVCEIKIDLKSMAYVFPAGHRIRVAISSGDFQNAWPVSQSATNTVMRGARFPSRVILPIVPDQDPKLPAPALEPSPNPLPDRDSLNKPEHTITYDLIGQTATVRTASVPSPPAPPSRSSSSFTVSITRPAEAVMKGTYQLTVSKPDAGPEIKVEAQCITTSDAKTFRHLVEVEVTVDGKRHFHKSWAVVVPREFN
jgi:putative CocE/NonD family hydrolase